MGKHNKWKWERKMVVVSGEHILFPVQCPVTFSMSFKRNTLLQTDSHQQSKRTMTRGRWTYLEWERCRTEMSNQVSFTMHLLGIRVECIKHIMARENTGEGDLWSSYGIGLMEPSTIWLNLLLLQPLPLKACVILYKWGQTQMMTGGDDDDDDSVGKGFHQPLYLSNDIRQHRPQNIHQHNNNVCS